MNLRHAFRKTRRHLHRWAWVVIASMAAMAGVLGVIGFRTYLASRSAPTSALDLIYLSLQLFTLESGAVDGPIPRELQLARFLAPAATASALARACWAVFEQQISELRLRFSRDHVIVCGLGSKGVRLAEDIRARGTRVVVIDSDESNVGLARCRDLGAFVLTGSASDPWLLKKARVHRAAAVIAVTGDDGTNVEAAVRAYELSRGRTGAPLQCIIHVVDPRLQSHLRQHEVFTSQADAFHIRIFNVFESCAEAMLVELRVAARANKSIRPHIVIAGFGRLGEAVFSNAVRFWRTTNNPAEHPIHITIVDRSASQKASRLSLSHLDLCRECELQVIEMDVASAEFERGEFLTTTSPTPTCVCICFDSDSHALTAALVVHDLLHELDVPIVVRMKENAGLATLVGTSSRGAGVVDGIRAVGMLDMACTIEHVLE